MKMPSVGTFLGTDVQADRVVPPTGFTANLTIFASAAMAFLAVFALALSMAAGRLADRWSEELARSATLRISAPADQMATQTDTALRVLRQTPGVASARALSDDEQAALLAPWFGTELPLEQLPIPRLIEVIETAEGYDANGLRLRLSAEVPGAILDDHTRWRRPLVDAAQTLRRLGVFCIILITGAMAAMITLAANAALAANGQVIEVLRLVGARDSYIAGAFVRRFTLRALIGSAIGIAAGIAGVALLPSVTERDGFLTGIGFEGLGWLLPLAIPVLGALVAFGATSYAARRVLTGLS